MGVRAVERGGTKGCKFLLGMRLLLVAMLVGREWNCLGWKGVGSMVLLGLGRGDGMR